MHKLLRAVRSVNTTASRVLAILLVALLAGLVGVVLMSVFFRYVLNSSLVWSVEAARYLDAWLVYLGLPIAHAAGSHVRIGILFDSVPATYRRYVEAFSELILLVLLLALALLGMQLTLSNFERGQVTPALEIQIAWVYLAVPVGLGLMSLQSLERLLALLLGDEEHSGPATSDEAVEIQAQTTG